MKSSISRQHIYLLVVSFVLLLLVILFSFGALIPAGKEYRINKENLKHTLHDYRKFRDFHDQTQQQLQEMRSQNRIIISAFDKVFDPSRFEKENKKHFSKLSISSVGVPSNKNGFMLYEVNTTSLISSPQGFYDFLEEVNKHDYIIQVNFPIDFKRDGEMIQSSFTMKVYSSSPDTNKTAEVSAAK